MTTYFEPVNTLDILKILGADHGNHKKKINTSDLRSLVLEGFPFSAFEAMQKEIDIPQSQLSTLLGIPMRTIARRKEDKQLTPVESDRLYRLARVVAYAGEVLGGDDKVRTWLKNPNRGLGGEIPLELLATDIGARQVEEVLQRIEYGIYG